MKPGFGGNHPKQGVAQYSHHACVLRTEAPERHSTQTRTQTSPAVAESEARLAIGFLVTDNCGPAAAESELAAQAMRKLRRPIRAMLTAYVAVEDTTKSRWTPVYSQIAKERFPGWCILGPALQLPQSV